MKKALQMILSLAIIVIGIYMMANNTLWSAPSLSGLAFIMTGLLHWMPHCPVCKALCKKQ
jgi:hypothetical protein